MISPGRTRQKACPRHRTTIGNLINTVYDDLIGVSFMELIGEKVKHNSFGSGTIIAQSKTIITVRFPERDVKFSYPNPDTFTKFLTAEDPDLQRTLADDATSNQKLKDEALKRQRAAWETKQERERLEKKRLEEAKQKELEAQRASEEERKHKLPSEYTTDELFVSDKALFGKASTIIKGLYGDTATFRPGQYEAIERTLKEKRLLVVQKTGWGKSLVYFVCTKLLRDEGAGVTLVISPLLALMENQLVQAVKMGLKCDVLNSTTADRKKEIIQQMEDGTLDLVLATPEALNSKVFKEHLPSIRMGLLVIDEAHCISDWGHDFRLEYSKIYKVIEQLQPNVPVLATTATANNVVIEDLTAQMGTPNLSRGHLMRENLSIQVLNLPEKEIRYAWILDNLPCLPGTGIIYCLSRKDCTWLADFLNENGITAEAYFSGNKDQEQRNREVLGKFINDEIKVIVSTIKLGMGFDKENVSFVVHFQCPKNVIAYYQQIGRAGRNIPFARTFLMHGQEDFRILTGFIEKAFPSEEDMRTVRQFITTCSGPCTKSQILAAIDISNQRLGKTLDFLEDGGLIEKEWRWHVGYKPYPVYRSTAAQFVYRRDHYEKIKQIRYRELQQMQDIAAAKGCLSRTVVSCLDDIEDHDCGVCSNCDPKSRFPSTVAARSKEKATTFLRNITIPIDPWEYWPRNNLVRESENKYPNLPGVALSKYDDGLGRLVKKGKYETGIFDDALVQKGAKILKGYIKKYQLTHITAVPSLNTNVVPDYAKRLARACGLTYVILLKKTNHSHQKDLNNTSHQFENAFQSFKIVSGVPVPKGIVLVDDIVDSGLTLAVCGFLLGQSGCENVFPLALADSTSGGKDDDDD